MSASPVILSFINVEPESGDVVFLRSGEKIVDLQISRFYREFTLEKP